MLKVLNLKENLIHTDDAILRFLLILLVSLSLIVPNHLYIIATVTSLVLIGFLVFNPYRITLLFLIYISLLPIKEWGQRYEIYRFYMNSSVLQIIFIFLIVNTIIVYIIDKSERLQWNLSPIAINLILLFLFIILGLIRGIILKHSSLQIVNEFFFLSLYLSFFILYFAKFDYKSLNFLWNLIFFLTIIVALQYFLILMGQYNLSFLSLTRISTRQAHLAPFALPFSMYLFYKPKLKNKIIAIFFSIPILFVILVSQQRALWIASIAVIIFVAFLENIHPKRKVNWVKFLRFVLIIIIVLAVLVGIVLFVFNAKLILLQRVQTLLLIEQDISATQRLAEIKNALKLWSDSKLFGTGLGDTVIRVKRYGETTTVDNSYIYYLWKLGVFGLILFISIWIMALIRGLKTLKITENFMHRRLIITAMSGISGILIIALTNSCMVNYRFNFVWGIALYTLDRINIGTMINSEN